MDITENAASKLLFKNYNTGTTFLSFPQESILPGSSREHSLGGGTASQEVRELYDRGDRSYFAIKPSLTERFTD